MISRACLVVALLTVVGCGAEPTYQTQTDALQLEVGGSAVLDLLSNDLHAPPDAMVETIDAPPGLEIDVDGGSAAIRSTGEDPREYEVTYEVTTSGGRFDALLVVRTVEGPEPDSTESVDEELDDTSESEGSDDAPDDDTSDQQNTAEDDTEGDTEGEESEEDPVADFELQTRGQLDREVTSTTIELTNIGDAALGPPTSIDGGPPYLVLDADRCGAGVEAGGSCIIEVELAEIALEERFEGEVFITMTANGVERTAGVQISAGGTARPVIEPANVALVSQGQVRSVSVVNEGNGALRPLSAWESAALDGDGGGRLVVEPGTCGSAVPPGGTCGFDLVLAEAPSPEALSIVVPLDFGGLGASVTVEFFLLE